MIEIVLKQEDSTVPRWMDVIDPSPEELQGLAENYSLHPAFVQDCMDPTHLPKIEVLEGTTFLIIRHYDEESDPKKNSVQAMTRKLAFFLGEGFLICVHRKRQEFIDKLKEKYRSGKHSVYLQVIMLELMLSAVQTYQRPLEEMERLIHSFEDELLRNQKKISNWGQILRTKARLSSIRRLLWHTKDAVQKFAPSCEQNKTLVQNLTERIDSLAFFAEGLLDDLNALLGIQLALAGHRTSEDSQRANHVMKVLTLFSAFFLPLNFIVGVYGMNFEYMPELKHPYGYFAVWAVLISITASIYIWFARKGWIRWGHLS
ncbi:hypothetical protein K2X33_10470 [bacterium]|nr:hypothetical protein [bacterium]